MNLTGLDKLQLEFHIFTSIEEIEIGKDLLCLVSSWEETPYFIVMHRKITGMVNSFDGTVLENTRILKYAYLPENIL